MAKSNKFSQWLSNSINESKDKKYRHRLLKENLDQRSKALEILKSYFQKAHEDVRRHLYKVAGLSLDPLDSPPAYDPAKGYPECLHIRTLKGYFGEVFAGLVAENFSPFEYNWKVPVFLFRFHKLAFEQLEMWRQTGEKPGIIPGSSGDDCLAFQRDEKGRVVRSLVCEAKCTPDHQSKMISDAHEKVSDHNPIPVNRMQLIEILLEYDDPESSQWVESLRQLWLDKSITDYERCDLVSYVCGHSPVKGGRKTWIPADKPYEKYTGGRRLEAIEAHLCDVEGLVREVYGKKDEVNG
ncbi:hypothetical protein HY02_00325 [Peptococcaceae bacterium SCADC1_2_3]|jgi:hypothetical protein|nr:hypothetical protein DK28_0200495 [Peptococcaceae bacterium SCADC1_2_3]KFI34824.1 hypothetical protein HY00_09520 [Peptococcaceae bacterium SCADC1_2_3]KFI38360.1 hypothetical protein HY02_00325 [Peptococcaceae bacterium SCADC1_2_3]